MASAGTLSETFPNSLICAGKARSFKGMIRTFSIDRKIFLEGQVANKSLSV